MKPPAFTGQTTPAGRPKEERPLAVVIVTYNSAAVLPGMLDSLRRGLRGIGCRRIVVVDNDSADDSGLIAAGHEVRPEIVHMGRNAGYAAGINAAAALVGPEADLLVLNPDIRLLDDAASRLRAHLADPHIGVVTPRIAGQDGALSPSLRREPSLCTAWAEALLGGRLASRLGLGEVIRDHARYHRSGPVEWATGAALLIGAEARRAAGEWDERFFLYGEEVDYLRRVRRQGFLVQYAPEAGAVHIGGDYRSSPFLSSLMALNRIRDYRHGHGRIATACFRLGVIVGEALRFAAGPGHRAALTAALRGGERALSVPAGPQITQ
jgi:GT2 family glycosyltransferase